MQTVIRNATVALTGAQSDLIAEAQLSGAQRKVMNVTNLNASGGNDVFIAVSEEAGANKGVRCAPGQTVTWSMDSGYKPPNDRFHAYAAGATSLAIYEEVELQ